MTRFIPKKFAENSNNSGVFGSFQEQGGNVGDGTLSSDPDTLQGGSAWPLGWSAATNSFLQIPRGEEIEGVERVFSAAIVQQFIDGITFWQPEMPVIQYQTIVQYQTDSDLPKIFVNITGTNTATAPDTDTTNWLMVLDFGSSFANVDLSNLSATGQAKFDAKANINLSNLNNTGNAAASNLNSKGIRTVVETYRNGLNWYRVWSDGWIEQGGATAGGGTTTNFIKQFADTNYSIQCTLQNVNVATYYSPVFYEKYTDSFKVNMNGGATTPNNLYNWRACGY